MNILRSPLSLFSVVGHQSSPLAFPFSFRDGILVFFNSNSLISGINVIAVGITDSIDAEFLRLLSGQEMSHTGQVEGKDYFKSPDFLSLNNILETVVTSVCETPDPSTLLFLTLQNIDPLVCAEI